MASRAGVLSDQDILKEMSSGNVVIKKFNAAHLNNCSYDVTLGEK